jgi:hypothetical protein
VCFDVLAFLGISIFQENMTQVFFEENETYFSSPRVENSRLQCSHCSEETLAVEEETTCWSDFGEMDCPSRTQSSSSICSTSCKEC